MTRFEALRARNEVGYGMQVTRNKVDDNDDDWWLPLNGFSGLVISDCNTYVVSR